MELDRGRFREIIRGEIKKNARRIINNDDITSGRIIVPIQRIVLPRFRYGHHSMGGVGSGEGETGTPLDYDATAGDEKVDHGLEVEVSLDELLDVADWDLPNFQPKSPHDMEILRRHYNSIHRSGISGLLDRKRTLRETLKRAAASGYDLSKLPAQRREDRRYRAPSTHQEKLAGYAVIMIGDISASVENEQRAWIRNASYGLSSWLSHKKGARRAKFEQQSNEVYIVHDASAKEVNRSTFFHITSGGGTRISAGYELAEKIALDRFPPHRWNLYFFHFSDGDNWDSGDNERCSKIIREGLLPIASLFGYCQVKSKSGTGQFMGVVESAQKQPELGSRITTARINDSSDIYNSIGALLKPKKAA
ncbi:MAG TPA: DUF444 family protein [Candidatus Nanoarchaeia archaeon]|nr:DUF444 family protein [Candidatus Nanoarchaeia archaeon]